MLIDAREILFIRQNCPRGMFRIISENTGIEYTKVRNEFFTLKDDYNETIVTEARRLLKSIYNIEFSTRINFSQKRILNHKSSQ